jgi:hypothetical protein
MVLGEHIFRQTLTDRCYIDTRATGNEFGSGRTGITYTDGTTLTPCRVTSHTAKEIPTNNTKISIIDSAIFLPASVAPASDSRIRVVLRNRATVNESYGVVSLEKQSYGNMANCKEAKGGTVI